MAMAGILHFFKAFYHFSRKLPQTPGSVGHSIQSDEQEGSTEPSVYKSLCLYRATVGILIPKALPWAMCLLAFQATLRIYVDHHFFISRINDLQKYQSYFMSGDSRKSYTLTRKVYLCLIIWLGAYYSLHLHIKNQKSR